MSTDASPSAPPPADAPSTEAELFAASAAENALPSDGKSLSDETTDLSALSAALPAADTDTTKEPADDDAEPESEPTLTKEEMIEEALNCPCVAAMRDGPCGDSFVSAYRCFLESETQPQGMDCMESFVAMQGCMTDHPDEYNLDDDKDPFAAAEEGGNSEGQKAEDEEAEGAERKKDGEKDGKEEEKEEEPDNPRAEPMSASPSFVAATS